ncbi:MAG: ribonuclease J, partial [Myxococcota bacterium]
EVGMNCCLIEHNGSMVMLDCGLTFPDTGSFGIDVILPDLSFVMEHLDRLDAVILTHGHEDHIGALPFFLREVDVPVYGGRLTLAMLERKLGEHHLDGEVQLHAVEPGEVLQVQGFEVEFVHINHSVPNAMSVALGTSLGRLVFTGDWKLDHTPIREETMDLQRFAEFGRQGTLALLADSTNAGTPGFSRSERSVQEGLASVLDTAEGRVIVAQFSSNIYRVQGMLELAEQFGRKVVLNGRSMNTNFQLARDLGFVEVPSPELIIDLHEAKRLPDDEVLIISTGSQGEPRASLTRMAYGSHSQASIRSTDTIVFSARVIPGNERGIQDIINELTKRGATVVTPKDRDIHATGHAKRDEMKLLLNLVKPKTLVPMHGNYRMRSQHAALAQSVGVPRSLLIDSGDVLEFTAHDARVVDRVHVGRVFVDGRSGGDSIEDLQLRDRKQLAHSGIIVAVAVIDRTSGELNSGPDLLQRGFLSDENVETLLPAASDYARAAFAELSESERRNKGEVSETIRTAVRRFFRKRLDRKPVVIPIIHDM